MRNMDSHFRRAGFAWGRLNGEAGYVKLYRWGSVVVSPSPRLGFVALSPAAPNRKRAGVFQRIDTHKPSSVKALKAWLASLEAIDRINESWQWCDGNTGTLNSSLGSRKVKPLHWKGGAHASGKNSRHFIPSMARLPIR